MIRILTLCALLLSMTAMADTLIPLYPDGIIVPLNRPESQDRIEGEMFIFNVSKPMLEAVQPTQEKANGTAVIVAPGGGFVGLAYEKGIVKLRDNSPYGRYPDDQT